MVAHSLGAIAAGRRRQRRISTSASCACAREGDYEGREGLGGKHCFLGRKGGAVIMLTNASDSHASALADAHRWGRRCTTTPSTVLWTASWCCNLHSSASSIHVLDPSSHRQETMDSVAHSFVCSNDVFLFAPVASASSVLYECCLREGRLSGSRVMRRGLRLQMGPASGACGCALSGHTCLMREVHIVAGARAGRRGKMGRSGVKCFAFVPSARRQRLLESD